MTGPLRRRGPGRPPAGMPVPEHGQVLERGLEAFAELGYEAVSVRQLNERLGMGHTFIHDRYGSKEAFWQAVMAAATRPGAPRGPPPLPRGAPRGHPAPLISPLRGLPPAPPPPPP